nr:zinc finger, CCHC-type [Tanacetum cinerariifolium]
MAPYTPQQNGVAERKNRTLKEMVNSMLSYYGLSEGFREPNDYVSVNSIIESRDDIFDEERFTSIPRPRDPTVEFRPNKGTLVSQLEYSRAVGCLMYAMISTRPDIAFVVGKLSSWINNTEDHSSTSGWVFLVGGGAICWALKKQTCITGSTMESEFVALAAAGNEAEWLRNLVYEISLWPKPVSTISIRCDNDATLADAYTQVYNGKSRHLAPSPNRCKLNFVFPNKLSLGLASDLERPITRAEVRSAVWGCAENKSPGPNGFTFEFFRKFWDILGADFCAAIDWFFEHCTFARGCNSFFITLISKTQDPKFVSDFRPISLIGSLYKVVTKILANRLSLVISDLISDVQTAFLPNRQILDGPFIINEL